MNRVIAGNGVAKPTEPRVGVVFDRIDRDYGAEDVLVIRYEIGGFSPGEVRAIEKSVVWYTEGKGEEDLGVHHFERIDSEAGLATAIPAGSMAVNLPASPLSYEGVIVKIRWCVRIRLFFMVGRDFVSEHVFELGGIPPARGVIERIA